MAFSDAYRRFQASTQIDHDKWREGIGYDLDAFAQMTAAEKDQVARNLRARPRLDWRDMEVLQALGDPDSFDKLRDVLAAGTMDERVHALRALIATGKMSGGVPDVQLAHVVDDLDGIEGMTAALLLAREHAGPMSNAALLRGARERPAVAVQFAGMLCFLAGLTNEEFDWNLRPLFLQLGESSPAMARADAFKELCHRIGITPEQIPEQGRGLGLAFPRSKRRT